MSEYHEISIVIPAYNEEHRIPARLNELTRHLDGRGYDYNVIVVDDGSRDRTAEVVSELAKGNPRIRLLRNGSNRGKGYSVKRGMLATDKPLALYSDADRSTPADEIDHLVRYIGEYDMVIGSRGLPDSVVVVPQPLYKSLLGKMGNLLIRFLAAPGIRDTQCGFKLFRRSAIWVFEKQTLDRWGFDFELLFIAHKSRMRIKEVPVVWTDDPSTRLRFCDYFRTLLELFLVRLNDLRGKYR